jgi:cysteine-rich repeat protein
MRIKQPIGLFVGLLGAMAMACGDGGSNKPSTDTGTDTGETDGGSASGSNNEAGEGSGGEGSGSASTSGDGDGDGDAGDGDGDPDSGDGDGDGDGDPDGGDGDGDGDGDPSEVCGDGLLGENEACDDANHDPGDGCDANCEIELYFICKDVGPGSCSPIRILYAVSDNDSEAFRASVAQVTGGPVDYFDTRAGTPSLMQMQADYDCVFSHPSVRYHDTMAMGTVLRDYVDAGGTVVLGIASDFPPPLGLDGTPIMEVGYSPVATAGMFLEDPQQYAGDGVTVLHTDVEAYGIDRIDTGVVLQGAGMADGTYGNGTIATAYRPDFKVVYLDGTGAPSFGATGNWDVLLANACSAGYLQ